MYHDELLHFPIVVSESFKVVIVAIFIFLLFLALGILNANDIEFRILLPLLEVSLHESLRQLPEYVCSELLIFILL